MTASACSAAPWTCRRPHIPVVSTSYATGAELAGLSGVRMRLAVDAGVSRIDVLQHPGGYRRACRPDRGGGRAPGLRGRRPRHQRQRLRIGRDPGDGDPAGRVGHQTDEPGPLRLLGRGRGRADRVRVLRLPADGPPAQGPCRQPQLRHGRLAELRPLRLRRRRLGVRREGPQRLGAGGEGLPGLLQVPEPARCADGVRRTVRLLRVHQQRHPGRRPVHRRGGPEDRGRGGNLRRHSGCPAGPVLPRGLRHHRQRQRRPCWRKWRTRSPTPRSPSP